MGDWGTQFGMLLAYMEALDNQSAEYELSKFETFYKAAKQRLTKVKNLRTAHVNCGEASSRRILFEALNRLMS